MLKSISSRSCRGGGATFPTFGTGAEPLLEAAEDTVRNVSDYGTVAASTESGVSAVSIVPVVL
jgi:hypothetical protein